MRVDTVQVKITVYYFYKAEKEALIELGVWNLLNDRLKDHERIEVE